MAANHQKKDMSQQLPGHLIGGVLFSYDAESDAFIEKGAPSNRIQMEKVWEDQLWSQFFFDHQTKNVYQGGFPNGERPGHVQLVILPTIPYCNRLGIPVKSHQKKQPTAIEKNQRKHKNGRGI